MSTLKSLRTENTNRRKNKSDLILTRCVSPLLCFVLQIIYVKKQGISYGDISKGLSENFRITTNNKAISKFINRYKISQDKILSSNNMLRKNQYTKKNKS
jgi:hypothetical protein